MIIGVNSPGALTLHAYDELGRSTDAWTRDQADEAVTRRQHLDYGDNAATATNSVGQLVAHYDEAGVVRLLGYDFKGNLLEKERQVVADAVFTGQWAASASPGGFQLPWSALPLGFNRHWNDLSDPARLAPMVYETSTAYDALNRATRLMLPQEASGSRPQLVPTYNRAGALAQVALDGQVLVERMAYNARGQRLLLARGNGLLTRYAYDAVSFRLTRLRTEGYTTGGETLTPQSGTVRQDTSYAYDLAGNITATRERAPQSGVGGTAELERLFEYDALYRLLSATGRENRPTAATPWQDETRSERVGSTTGYIQFYQYDLLGNIQQLRHTAATSTDSFTRQFAYQPGRNYLQSVAIGNQRLDYRYDATGNVVQEQESRHLQWDAADQLRQFATWTGPNSAPTLLAYYVYDAGGQRTKKLTQTGVSTWQVTVYVDGVFEHRYEVSGGAVGKDQTTLYVLSDQSRLYQRRSGENLDDQRPAELYTIEDHLGSGVGITDAAGGLVSWEEYYAFGETSFGSTDKQRYRFCGKERDQESGLYYYGLRYYAAWLCRFVSVDPLAGKYTQYAPYQYAGNKPITFVDLDGGEEKRVSHYTPFTYDRLKKVAADAGVYSQSFGAARAAATAKGETDKDKIERAGQAAANRRIGGGFEKAFLDAWGLKPNNETFKTDIRTAKVKPDAILSGSGFSVREKSVEYKTFSQNIFVEVKSTPSVSVNDPNGQAQIKGHIQAIADQVDKYNQEKPGNSGAGFLLIVTVAGAEINQDVFEFAMEKRVAVFQSQAYENPDNLGSIMFSEAIPAGGPSRLLNIARDIYSLLKTGKPYDLKLVGKEVKLDLTEKNAAQGGNRQ